MAPPPAVRRTVSAGAVVLTALALTACPASNDGTAFLFNESGQTGLQVVVSRPDGRPLEGGPFETVYSFDVQWTDREQQCYVESDGYLEVLRGDGSVVVHHDFADGALCEHDELTLGEDKDLVWQRAR